MPNCKSWVNNADADADVSFDADNNINNHSDAKNDNHHQVVRDAILEVETKLRKEHALTFEQIKASHAAEIQHFQQQATEEFAKQKAELQTALKAKVINIVKDLKTKLSDKEQESTHKDEQLKALQLQLQSKQPETSIHEQESVPAPSTEILDKIVLEL